MSHTIRHHPSINALMRGTSKAGELSKPLGGAKVSAPIDSFERASTTAAATAAVVTAPAMDLHYDGGATYNPDVVKLQRALVKAGAMTQAQMDTGPGRYGPLTRAAVNRIQQNAGITDDGGYDYGPRTRAALQAALNPPTGKTGTLAKRDATTARRIDAVLASYPGSHMQGMGAVIIAACRKEHVPVDLLLAQIAKESTFMRGDNTISVANNNPGNLRPAGWEGQFGGVPASNGFERFPTVEAGIRAYAHLMGSPEFPYRKLVDAKNWSRLVHLYAPSSDGNDEAEYVQELTQFKAMFAGEIGVGSNWINEK